ncbi:Na+/H+ antiporter NhaC family protein, partial [Staphylococcus aureus]|uniref:Na+/H+ antiporter NhaC family protein n=1 Tax=Staphylococcus aureus TaxID=1280 RepID=UPI00235606DF
MIKKFLNECHNKIINRKDGLGYKQQMRGFMAHLSVKLRLLILALIALIGTASALGDSGSPASDSTLGPTAGLNVDGQHDHIRDTCVPNFLFYNIPLMI